MKTKLRLYIVVVIVVMLFFSFSPATGYRREGRKRADEFREKTDKAQERALGRREALRLERKQRRANATGGEHEEDKIVNLEHKIRKLETSMADVRARLDLIEKMVLGDVPAADINAPLRPPTAAQFIDVPSPPGRCK